MHETTLSIPFINYTWPKVGNDINVFLGPLMDEQIELWEPGVETYDASKDETFDL